MLPNVHIGCWKVTAVDASWYLDYYFALGLEAVTGLLNWGCSVSILLHATCNTIHVLVIDRICSPGPYVMLVLWHLCFCTSPTYFASCLGLPTWLLQFFWLPEYLSPGYVLEMYPAPWPQFPPPPLVLKWPGRKLLLF